MGILERVKGAAGLTSADCDQLAMELQRAGHVGHLVAAVGKGGTIVMSMAANGFLADVPQWSAFDVVMGGGAGDANLLVVPDWAGVTAGEPGAPVMVNLGGLAGIPVRDFVSTMAKLLADLIEVNGEIEEQFGLENALDDVYGQAWTLVTARWSRVRDSQRLWSEP